MTGYDPGETFYEEDEPLEDVQAAFGRGVKGVTARPVLSPEDAWREMVRLGQEIENSPSCDDKLK